MFTAEALWSLRWAALNLSLIWLVGAVTLRFFGASEERGSLSWGEAFFEAYYLMFFEPVADLAAHPLGQLIQYGLPVAGIFVAAEGLLKLGLTVFRKDAHPEKWMSILAGTSRDHVILCGLGTVGFRVLEELVALDARVFVIERNEQGEFLDRARELGAEILIGDARSENLLRTLNVNAARAVVVATDDDLANLEIAMDVRELRTDVPIVLRLFDQRLASKVQKTLGFEVSLSTSRLAAPLFAAAALDASVVGALRVGGDVQAVMEITVAAGGRLDGATVGEVMGEHRLTVIAVKRQGHWRAHPAPGELFAAGDEVQVMVSGSEVARVHGVNSAAT